MSMDNFEELDLGGFGAGEKKPADKHAAASKSGVDDFEIEEFVTPSPAKRLPPGGRPGSQPPRQIADGGDDFEEFGSGGKTDQAPVRPSAVSPHSEHDFGDDDFVQPTRQTAAQKPTQAASSRAAAHSNNDFGDEDFTPPRLATAQRPAPVDDDFGFGAEAGNEHVAGAHYDDEETSADVTVHEDGTQEYDHDKSDYEDEHQEEDEEGHDSGKGSAIKALISKYGFHAGVGALGIFAVFGGWNYVGKPYLAPVFGWDQSAPAVLTQMTPVGQSITQPPANPSNPQSSFGGQQTTPHTTTLPPPSVQPVLPPAPTVDQAAMDKLKSTQDAAIKAISGDVANISAHLDQRLRPIEDRLAALEARGSAPMPKPAIEVPLKPEVMNGWRLQGVSRDTAWVKGPDGQTYQVRAGDQLAGGASVIKISKYDKDYVVVTDHGVIIRN